MTHCALHLVNVEGGVPGYHHLDVPVLRSKSLYTDVLKSSVGDGFTHFLQLCSDEGFLHKIIIRVFSLLHHGVYQLVHGRANDLVRYLLVLVHELV